jgi:SAM-dependent methyltransferase
MNIACRICNTKLTNRIFNIPNMPLTDDFIETSMSEKMEYVRDINIYRCNNCGVTQNPDDFDHETYYQDYQYSTGHSEFTKRFMAAYAAEIVDTFKGVNGRGAASALEVGSGDGQQLMFFKPLGVKKLIGVEPSEYLARIANETGIKTEIALFGTHMLPSLPDQVDVCLSSYTFDHVRQPLDYLAAAHKILVDGGILALEIHDFGKIVVRTEYCLFEHEHTIYLNDEDVRELLERTGFSVLSINPLPSELTRGNSLIVLAKKETKAKFLFQKKTNQQPNELAQLHHSITSTIKRIDDWIDQLPESARLVGFGAGGRGVMTVAALSGYKRFEALLDSNYRSEKYLTPKTRISIAGPDTWMNYNEAYCIVFSYGYYEEILYSLLKVGFDKSKVLSLLEFYPNSKL